MAGIHEIRVTTEPDIKGHSVLAEAERIGVKGLRNVQTSEIFLVEGVLTPPQLSTLAAELFSNPLDGQVSTIDSFPETDAQNVVRVAYHPGVMDPVAESIKEGASYLGVPIEAAATAMEYRLFGDLSPEEVNLVTRRVMNPTVQEPIVNLPETLLIKGEPGPTKTVQIKGLDTERLMALSKDKLFLDESEMHTIQEYFESLDRDPTDCELEIIAARNSEHCGHKTFKAKVIVDGVEKKPLIERIKEAAYPYLASAGVATAFEDNSGGMDFYEGLVILAKVETHNSPSAIEPRGGAMTGTGGVVRDIIGTGKVAKTILSTDMFFFAPPDLDPAKLPPGTLPPDYLFTHVAGGVRDYGNPLGIPTANGSVHFHENARAKPSVIVGAYGIIPKERAQKGYPEVGDLVIAVGGRTGRDGIHGATFSSGEMTDRTISVNSTAVQIGDPIQEKKMSDALLEAGEAGLVRAITDCGAAGFSSAVGEMGEETGVKIDLSKVLVKYPGLSPWELLLSESQERMVVAISPENEEAFLKICRKHNVEASVFGEFDGSHRMQVLYGDEVAADLDYDFLTKGLGQRVKVAHFEKPHFDEAEPEVPTDWAKSIKAVLSHGNVCSKQPFVDQYDKTVQGMNAMQPFGGVNHDGPNDAVILTPILGKPYGMIVANGMNPALNDIDPRNGSIWAVSEAMSNLVAVGGNPKDTVLINNYIWPFPDEESMGSLDLSVDAVVDCMHALQIPVVSGKDSLSSTYRGKDGTVIKIPPVLCISVMGKIPDVEKTVSADIKREGSYLYLVGKTDSGMGGSTYFDVNGLVGNDVPKVDLEILPVTLQAVHHAILTGEVFSCHDVSEGGIIGAVSEMAFGGDCGVELDLGPGIERPDMFLFNETAGTFVVEVENPDMATIMFGHLPHIKLGKTTAQKRISARVGDSDLFSIPTDELKQAWQEPMRKVFK